MKIEFTENNFIRFLEKLVQWGTRDTHVFFSMTWDVFDPLGDPLIVGVDVRYGEKNSLYKSLNVHIQNHVNAEIEIDGKSKVCKTPFEAFEFIKSIYEMKFGGKGNGKTL